MTLELAFSIPSNLWNSPKGSGISEEFCFSHSSVACMLAKVVKEHGVFR